MLVNSGFLNVKAGTLQNDAQEKMAADYMPRCACELILRLGIRGFFRVKLFLLSIISIQTFHMTFWQTSKFRQRTFSIKFWKNLPKETSVTYSTFSFFALPLITSLANWCKKTTHHRLSSEIKHRAQIFPIFKKVGVKFYHIYH